MATALIVIPVALSAATDMDVSAKPVLMSVTVAAAASFLTPVATPANLMVMGPGGYRFGDYWKLGLPLLVLCSASSRSCSCPSSGRSDGREVEGPGERALRVRLDRAASRRTSASQALVAEAYERYRGERARAPCSRRLPGARARIAADLFGICVVGHRRPRLHGRRRATCEFTIMSVSKPFVVRARLRGARRRRGARRGSASTPPGCRSTRSRRSSGARDGRTNPMVNPGAIAATSLVPGEAASAGSHPRRASRASPAASSRSNDEVYRSASATNCAQPGHRARCSQSYGRIDCDPAEAVDLYTRQCSLNVTAHDLAVMGATLADGGVNPLTRRARRRRRRLPLHARRDDDRRAVRDVGRLALRRRAAGQERHRRRDRHRLARQGRARHVRAAARRRRQQRQGTARGALPVARGSGSTCSPRGRTQ